MRRSTFMEI
uniref:Uncharacterized protein n=1 Tax=Rhizophora mucronata TaxID=61149 RepID=A0A2P2R0M0_RHIMU